MVCIGETFNESPEVIVIIRPDAVRTAPKRGPHNHCIRIAKRPIRVFSTGLDGTIEISLDVFDEPEQRLREESNRRVPQPDRPCSILDAFHAASDVSLSLNPRNPRDNEGMPRVTRRCKVQPCGEMKLIPYVETGDQCRCIDDNLTRTRHDHNTGGSRDASDGPRSTASNGSGSHSG